MKNLELYLRSGASLMKAQLTNDELADEVLAELSDGKFELTFLRESGEQEKRAFHIYYRRWYGQVLKVYCDEITSQQS